MHFLSRQLRSDLVVVFMDGGDGHTLSLIHISIDTALHTTKDDAIDYLHKLAEKYPNSRDVSIIVFDV